MAKPRLGGRNSPSRGSPASDRRGFDCSTSGPQVVLRLLHGLFRRPILETGSDSYRLRATRSRKAAAKT